LEAQYSSKEVHMVFGRKIILNIFREMELMWFSEMLVSTYNST
jgi:hypothetical protein